MEKDQTYLRKHELNQTCNSKGWWVAMDIANDAVKAAQEELMACKDKDQRDELFLKAQAAKEFLENFQKRIQAARSVETTDTEDFISVVTD